MSDPKSTFDQPRRRGPKPLTREERERTLEVMRNNYSVRARAARLKQGLPAVIEDHAFLNKVSRWMTEDLANAKSDEASSTPTAPHAA